MNRRDVFGRVLGMTAAAVALAKLKEPRKSEPKDYGLTDLKYEGKPLVSTSTQTMPYYCARCRGQMYGRYDGLSHICRCHS